MKKLLLLLLLVCGFTYSQTKKFNCYCPPKKPVHHNKYIVKKKPIVKKPCEVIVNNIITCPPQKIEVKTIETRVIETKVIEKEIVYIQPPVLKSNGPILEIYTGYVEAKNDDLKYSYLIGANLYLDLFQSQRQGAQQRVYANRLLIGFEHSALISNDIVFTHHTPASESAEAICDCIVEAVDQHEASDQTFTFKHKVRAVSLNVGVEVYKGWYLLSGLTDYQHIITLNKEEFTEYRTMYIDAGLQKVIKHNRWFFIPKIKFNPETTTFAIGVSYK